MNLHYFRTSSINSDLGATLVELAISVPVLVFIVFSTISAGLSFREQVLMLESLRVASNSVNQIPQGADVTGAELCGGIKSSIEESMRNLKLIPSQYDISVADVDLNQGLIIYQTAGHNICSTAPIPAVRLTIKRLDRSLVSKVLGGWINYDASVLVNVNSGRKLDGSC